MERRFVKVEKGLGPQGRIAVVRFDRGDNINALSNQAMRELRGTSRNSRIAWLLSALMLSPRSKRTTAIRPCGPSPFSTLTKRRSIRRSSPVDGTVATSLYKREPLGLTAFHVEI